MGYRRYRKNEGLNFIVTMLAIAGFAIFIVAKSLAFIVCGVIVLVIMACNNSPRTRHIHHNHHHDHYIPTYYPPRRYY